MLRAFGVHSTNSHDSVSVPEKVFRRHTIVPAVREALLVVDLPESGH
jgi:hypothetical protein